MSDELTLDDLFSDAAAFQSGTPTQSDDDVLGANLTGRGGGNRGGQDIETMLKLGAKERANERASSMMIDGVDFRQLQEPPEGPAPRPVSNQKLQRMPAKNVKAQLLTDQDIRTLAENKDYPVDFMGEDYFVDPRQRTESALAYSEIESPFEREEFLRKRRDFILQKRKEDEERDYMIQHPATAYGAGAALAIGGGLMGTSLAGGIAPFAAYLAEFGVPLTKISGAGYFVKKLYDDLVSDPGITEEEAQKKIREEVQKQLRKQQDTGSAGIVEG